MKMTEWWGCNAKYVKAYAGYIVIMSAFMWAFQALAGVLHLHSLICSGLKGIGIPERPSHCVSSIGNWIAFMVLGFFIFRNAVRKFVLYRPE